MRLVSFYVYHKTVKLCFTVRLESRDVILKIKWSNWDNKKEEICSRIKFEIHTALEEEKNKFEKEMIKCLLDQYNHGGFLTLTNIIDALYHRFDARLYRITGGCVELWVRNESYEKLELMRMKQKEIESLLARELCHLSDDKTRKGAYWFSVSILDVSLDELDMPEPEMFPDRYNVLFITYHFDAAYFGINKITQLGTAMKYSVCDQCNHGIKLTG